MESKSIRYIEWDTLESCICEKLRIPKEFFYDYHEVVGGEYLNLWHVWQTIVYDDIHNGCISFVHDVYFTDEEKKRLLEEYDERIIPFFDVLVELVDNNVWCDGPGFWVHYSW